MRCQACEGETPDGKRFCQHCGKSLAVACLACGAQLEQLSRFCPDCGTPVGAAIAPRVSPAFTVATTEPPQQIAAFSTELRHVSVLFCDLVGFTPLAELRDPEEVRELLSGYFELARAIVARYGGVVAEVHR